MSNSSAGKALPLILAAITVATAIFFFKQRETLRAKTQELLTSRPTPTVTVSPRKTVTPTPFAVPSVTPTTIKRHAVVDTAIDTSVFYNLAGASYVAGLLALIKAKRIH